MLQNAYFLAKIGADTAENEHHFAEILPTDATRSSRCFPAAKSMLDSAAERHLAHVRRDVVLRATDDAGEVVHLQANIHAQSPQRGRETYCVFSKSKLERIFSNF